MIFQNMVHDLQQINKKTYHLGLDFFMMNAERRRWNVYVSTKVAL